MKAQIKLDTTRDVRDFVAIANSVNCDVFVTDNAGLTVNAKSMMGMLYSLEFEELWCESELDIYSKIQKFTVD